MFPNCLRGGCKHGGGRREKGHHRISRERPFKEAAIPAAGVPPLFPTRDSGRIRGGRTEPAWISPQLGIGKP